MSSQSQSFKVILLGNGGVGKTSLVLHQTLNQFEGKYLPTIDAEIHPLIFNTNYGIISISLWDTPGQERNAGLYDGYLFNANLALVFYSVDSKLSAKNITYWEKIAKNTPTFTVGTKSSFKNVTGIDSLIINSKNGDGIKDLWLQVLIKLTGHLDISII